MISAASSAGDASMNLSGWNSARAASPRRSSRASIAVRPDVAGQHPGPLDRVQRAGRTPSRPPPRAGPRGARSGARRSRTLTMPVAVRGSTTGRAARRAAAPWPPPPRRPRSPRTPRRPRAASAPSPDRARARPPRAPRRPPWRRRTSGRRPGASPPDRRPPPGAPSRPRPAQPTPIDRWSASGNGRPVRNTAAIGSSSGDRPARYVGQDRRLLGRLRGRRDPLGDLAPAAHDRDGIGCRRCSIAGGSRIISRATRRPAPARAGEPARLHALVPGSRGRPADALPGRADAGRGDRALLHDAVARPGFAWRWASTSARRTGSSGRARSASSTATTARRCSTSRSASGTPGATATAARRPA